MSNQAWMSGSLEVLREGVEVGQPGDRARPFWTAPKRTAAANHGLLATLAELSAARASDLAALGQSVTAHAAHLA